MRDLLGRAARNNALWCDAVCSAHGAPGEFQKALWLNRAGTPQGYPNVVTLTPAEAAVEQTEAVASLLRSTRSAGCAVKDSFHCLDLRPLGFTVLFDAEWILHEPLDGGAQAHETSLPWRTVDSGGDLALWERAWTGDAATAATSPIFPASLLSRSDVSFHFAPANAIPLCGGILNKGAGVVGLSNVFHTGVDPEIAWRGLLREAAKKFPSLPVVGYEAGNELAVAQRIGFQSMGPLRVWLKT